VQIREAKEKFPVKIAFHFMVTSCNAEMAKRFLGVWISVLREVMSLYSIKRGLKVDYLLSKMIKGSCVEDSKITFRN
jgi:hypothetical protein